MAGEAVKERKMVNVRRIRGTYPAESDLLPDTGEKTDPTDSLL